MAKKKFEQLENNQLVKVGDYTIKASKLGAAIGAIGTVLLLLSNLESMAWYEYELFLLGCLISVAGFMLISRPVTLILLGLLVLGLIISLLVRASMTI